MYVRQIELTRFKSFGSTTVIPLLPGFTVISGPNGSGKSNILDALLFALGLSSSRGMRAEKLLDLVHSGSLEGHKRRVETSVSVTFALGSSPQPTPVQSPSEGAGDPPDAWKVTRRLRVNPNRAGDEENPGYTSTFYINDVPCTLAELHEQLEAMHIYPNGYNVVLQGDVTSIISMNAKERRQIIDELAGVATFDRKITQANNKLEAVREQIERFRLIEQEWQAHLSRLVQESQKAQHYQQLRRDLAEIEARQQILTWRHLHTQIEQLNNAIQEHQQQQATAQAQQAQLREQLTKSEQALAEMQSRIHALGEEEYLQMQSQIATWQAQKQQLQQQIQTGQADHQSIHQHIHQSEVQIQEWQTQQTTLEQRHIHLARQQQELAQQHQQAQTALLAAREHLQALAQSADAWVKQQRYLTRQMEETRQLYDPSQQEAIRLEEQYHQLARQEQTLQAELAQIEAWLGSQSAQAQPLAEAQTQAEIQVQTLAAQLAALQTSLETDQATTQRLQSEFHTKQRQLDKLETRQQVLQDTQGSRASQVITAAQLPGVLGLVAQLAEVDPQYQIALEMAAGNRLNFWVVEDDTVASSAIHFLKREKAGRATFLPLNKLQPTRPPSPLHLPGAVDYAVRLVRFADRFRDVFGFVFGQTVVFESLSAAQPHIGRYRMVTLEGELLETSGAMTGGSQPQKSSLHFGARESAEVESLRHRLNDLEDLLHTLTPRLQAQQAQAKQLTQALAEWRQTAQQAQQAHHRHQTEWQTRHDRQQHLQQTLHSLQTQRTQSQARLQHLQADLQPLQARLSDLTLKLKQLEDSPVNQHWQQAQATLQQQEGSLHQLNQQIRDLEQQQQQILSQQQINQAQQSQQQERIQEWRQRQNQIDQHIEQQQTQISQCQAQIDGLQEQLALAEARLAHLRQQRDQQEFQLRTQQQQLQRLEWDHHHALTQQQEKEILRQQLVEQAELAHRQLPDPLPEVPAQLTLEELQRQRRRTEEKLRALEPVNMLAIQEVEDTQNRLSDLSQKLETLQQERTELLLRIENFATLRRQAFLDAFAAVDHHFRAIFAQLSDGDGHLELENPQDPLAGGLSLVAHPKGKPVRRLTSMSGGEKSLTALSFIFALQRYRPSSFYAFDEVDMFLDGANVERLATMIWQQAQQAQFMVVSLRRPMIEKAERTIGVTQARGSYTQVIGLPNRA
ncbi:MAG: chromosome segregation protein SMC [Cyanobacteriota bacterium]|nr:chromosome segregation protein SMC [Cyanobacteriota bacterium]